MSEAKSDRGKIILGIVIFLVLILLPIWYSAASGGTGTMPELDVGVEAPKCVRDGAWMRANHMDVLDQWRDEVVRGTGPAFFDFEDERFPGGKAEKSLSRTCMACHTNYEGFCQRCHDYMSVTPYCWDCHNRPTSGKVGE